MLYKQIGCKYKISGAISSLYRNYSSTDLCGAYVPANLENIALDSKLFEPPIKSEELFSVLLPPPNVTGTLHLGHALTVTVQDVLIKWNRMKGINTLWTPGMDHAGIATQVVVEKRLLQQKKQTRHDIGREKFEQEIWNWKNEKSDIISKQLRRLGASLNWDKEFFTMDPNLSESVNAAFIKLHQSGLIYRSDYLVNWSCILQSAISDMEVENVNIEGPTLITVPGYKEPIEFGVLTKFAYKLDNSDEEIVVATTRPETMLGDVAVAVNPSDARYSSFIGRNVLHPFRNELIPVIADEFVDIEFGTGAVKITPAHDHNDFEVGKRHNLKSIQIINEKGEIISTTQLFNGIPRYDARKMLIASLKDLNLFRGEQDHAMVVPICCRSKDVIEFIIKPQWFLNCKEMAQIAMEDVINGGLIIEPKHFEKIWFHWLENIRDWCISRQLWWGHRIPIYYGESISNPLLKCVVAAENIDEATKKCENQLKIVKSDLKLSQDQDVLDTWFSSALLPLTLAGWPKMDTKLINKNYPISLMETGHDILFFWVARMVMLGTQLTGKLPFPKILLHGIICDANGRKMSKSLGNVISPEDVISGRTLKELETISKTSYLSGILSKDEFAKTLVGQKKMFPEGIPECGVDALRFTLCSHNIKSNFISFDVQECKINKFFGNKIFQATKYTLKWLEKVSESQQIANVNLDQINNMDKWILSRLSLMVQIVNESLENYDFHNATNALKTFLYYEFCDVYLEATKRGLQSSESQQALNHCYTLLTCFNHGLKCLAPFMPHLSQHLHAHIFKLYPKAIKDAYFPKDLIWRDEKIENDVECILNTVTAIRRLKKIFNITAKHKPKVLLKTNNSLYLNYIDVIESLANCGEIDLQKDFINVDLNQYAKDKVGNEVDIYLFIPQQLKKDLELDYNILNKRKDKLLDDLTKLENQLSNLSYQKKMNVETHQRNIKKKITIEEKISRINYLQTFSR